MPHAIVASLQQLSTHLYNVAGLPVSFNIFVYPAIWAKLLIECNDRTNRAIRRDTVLPHHGGEAVIRIYSDYGTVHVRPESLLTYTGQRHPPAQQPNPFVNASIVADVDRVNSMVTYQPVPHLPALPGLTVEAQREMDYQRDYYARMNERALVAAAGFTSDYPVANVTPGSAFATTPAALRSMRPRGMPRSA